MSTNDDPAQLPFKKNDDPIRARKVFEPPPQTLQGVLEEFQRAMRAGQKDERDASFIAAINTMHGVLDDQRRNGYMDPILPALLPPITANWRSSSRASRRLVRDALELLALRARQLGAVVPDDLPAEDPHTVDASECSQCPHFRNMQKIITVLNAQVTEARKASDPGK